MRGFNLIRVLYSVVIVVPPTDDMQLVSGQVSTQTQSTTTSPEHTASIMMSASRDTSTTGLGMDLCRSPLSIPVVQGKAAHFASCFVDIRSRIWMSYRHSFPAFPGTNMTTDVGWGCMLRAAQMMVANAIEIHLLGRGRFLRMISSIHYDCCAAWLVTSKSNADHDVLRSVCTCCSLG